MRRWNVERRQERAARSNFIWLCPQRRRASLKRKKLVSELAWEMELRAFFVPCMNGRVIQGIDRCASCESEDSFLSGVTVA